MAEGFVRGRTRWACVQVAMAAVASLGIVAPAFGLGALADADAQKAAVKCQALIAKTASKALTTKLKAFNACAAAALACVETKAADADCPAKAAATCTKKLAGAASAAVKAEGTITANKSCLALGTTELLGSDGLGYGDLAGSCSADFDLDVCDGIQPIAACVLATHEVGAGALFGRPAPRTSEILALLPGAPFPDAVGLEPQGGCGSCSAPEDARKGVEKCGKALATGTQNVAGALEGAFAKCTLELYECAQTKADDAACIAAATAACTKAAPKVAKAVAKLGAVATKACGDDFAAASVASGLNLGALSSRCAALGVSPIDGPDAIAACLAAESRCAVAALVRNALPRTAEFSDASQLGGLATDLDATCPTAMTLQKARSAGAAKRGVFGSILKLVKSVRRTVPSALGVRTTGGKPASTGGGGSGVKKVSGPSKFKFGSIGKFKVSYHGPGNLARAGGGPRVPGSSMIVAVSRPDIVLDDHFEIPLLDLPLDGSDVEDELEIEFSDSIPACAFELSFATKTGGEVSEYGSILQVLDEEQPVLPSVELASQGPAGVQQNGVADGANVAVSADGRYVAFTSLATNLISPADTNGTSDVYLRDRCIANGVPIDGCTPATTVESIGPGGEPFHDGAAGHVGVSDDGRYVAFSVTRRNDPNPPIVQSFVKDRCLSNGQPVDSCTVVNTDVTYDGESNSSGGTLTSFSSDGRFVVFTSTTSFGPGLPRVFLLDTCVSSSDPVFGGCESFLERISDSEGGGEPDGDSDYGAVSRSGRFIAYRSDGSDILEAGTDTNGANDVFLRDHCMDPATGTFFPGCTRTTERINLGPGGAQSAGDDPDGLPLTNVAVSDDGRFVAYTSSASDLLGPGADTNDLRDVFVHDRCVDANGPVADCTPGNDRVNVGPGGSESNGEIPGGFAIGMSKNGRLVVFASNATNLLGPAVGAPTAVYQIFLRDRCRTDGVAIDGCTPSTTLVSAAPDKGLGTASSSQPAIAANGSTIGFVSAAPNLLGLGVDANNLNDVFVRDR